MDESMLSPGVTTFILIIGSLIGLAAAASVIDIKKLYFDSEEEGQEEGHH